jgi:protein-S-isoprenylcysteine O-methyltransferase Ste14
MIVKYGEIKAWNIYEMQTSFMFFQRGLSFGLLTHATQWTIIDFVSNHFFSITPESIVALKYLCMIVGFLLVVVGFWVNTAATFVIGIDTYYYKDLFLKRSLVDFKVEGPYKYFSNPMYGIGQSSAYGASLFVGSLSGIVVTILNQVMMYTFYFLIEKPHIAKMIEGSIMKQATQGKLIVKAPSEIEAFA